MLWRLDKFDWQYRSGDICLGFCLSLLLWPVFLALKPKMILKGDAVRGQAGVTTLDVSGSMANRMRSFHKIVMNPPECGATVLYKYPDTLIEGLQHIDLFFRSADIASHFKGKNLPLFWQQEKRALVAFLNARDEASDKITEIPGDIDFNTMAFDLLDNNFGEANCPICQSNYAAAQLEYESPPMHPGWNFRTYSCPKGHKLFSCRTMHIMARRD
jgi:hypothetical protein